LGRAQHLMSVQHSNCTAETAAQSLYTSASVEAYGQFVNIICAGVRGKLVSLVPKSIMLATAGGIGLFLAFIGLQNSEGIGLVTYNSATLVTLGEGPNPPATAGCRSPLSFAFCMSCAQQPIHAT
jgi:MFS superfamily sulfate permease-like transporter